MALIRDELDLVGSMRLIESAKHGRWGVRKKRVEGRKAYSDGQEATRERNSRHFLLQPSFWAHVTDRLSF